MRIIHFIDNFGNAGAERVALQLGEGMAARGHTVLMLALRGPATAEVAGLQEELGGFAGLPRRYLLGVEEYRWPAGIFTMARRLRGALREFEPDWLEIHSTTAACVFAVARPQITAVLDFHGFDNAWRPGGGVRRMLSRGLRRAAARRAVALTAPSRELAEVATRALCLPAGSVRWVPHGVDVARFAVPDRRPGEADVICTVGRLIAGKRPHDALRAFALLARRRPGMQLWFAGDGPLRVSLKREAATMGLEDCVHLLGARTDMPAVLAQAHLLWHLSEREGFGLACTEAMATGLPVIGYDVPGVREVVADGETGLLVKLGDTSAVAEASERLLGDGELYHRFSAAGRRRVEERYSLEAMIDGHLALMQPYTAAAIPECRAQSDGAGT